MWVGLVYISSQPPVWERSNNKIEIMICLGKIYNQIEILICFINHLYSLIITASPRKRWLYKSQLTTYWPPTCKDHFSKCNILNNTTKCDLWYPLSRCQVKKAQSMWERKAVIGDCAVWPDPPTPYTGKMVGVKNERVNTRLLKQERSESNLEERVNTWLLKQERLKSNLKERVNTHYTTHRKLGWSQNIGQPTDKRSEHFAFPVEPPKQGTWLPKIASLKRRIS